MNYRQNNFKLVSKNTIYIHKMNNLNPKLKKLVFEDFINKVKTEIDEYVSVVGEVIANNPDLLGGNFDLNSFLAQHKKDIEGMYLNNVTPMKAAEELIKQIRLR
jgi:hypothetical protein